jgi:hypothetical protein
MIPVTYIAPGEKTSPVFCLAFAQGCGGIMQIGGQLRDGPMALFGSPLLWPIFTQARQEGRTFYYGDKGYFGRGEYFRVTKNSLQHNGVGAPAPKRFDTLNLKLEPTRVTGTHVLVCPNGAVQYTLFGGDIGVWLTDVVNILRVHTDRPIRIRFRGAAWPLSEDLKDAWAMVTWSSNAAVEGVMAGVPVFVQFEQAAAYGMGIPDLSKIEEPVRKTLEERERFCHVLAGNQWTLDEMRQGIAWAHLRAS